MLLIGLPMDKGGIGFVVGFRKRGFREIFPSLPCLPRSPNSLLVRALAHYYDMESYEDFLTSSRRAKDRLGPETRAKSEDTPRNDIKKRNKANKNYHRHWLKAKLDTATMVELAHKNKRNI